MKNKLITGRYKGYEVCYANKGQIFPRDGYYLTKGNDVIYLEDAIDQTREETIREIEELLLENLRYDEYVLYSETGYITEIKIKDILNKLKK